MIKSIADEFIKRGEKCIGIHESFADDDKHPDIRKSVPNPDNHDSKYWIHQYKLLEGIDDPRFQILVIIEPLKSARAVVQQVGRVIRNPNRASSSVAHVLDFTGKKQEALWKGFRSYDDRLREKGLEGIKYATGEGLIDQFLKVQPWSAYLDGRFRQPFSFDDVNPYTDIQIPLEVNLLEKSNNFSIDKLCNIRANELKMNDAKYKIYGQNKSQIIYLYLIQKASPILKQNCFIECKLGITVVIDLDKFVAMYDSRGWIPRKEKLIGILKPLPPDKLRKLFLHKGKGKLTSITLQNSNLGITAIRTKSFELMSRVV